MRRRFTEYTNTRRVFKQTYIGACIGGVFALVSGFAVHYDDSEFNIVKWKGLFLGTVIWAAVLVGTYFLSRTILALGITLFVGHIVHIILFGIFYKTGL